MIRKGTKLSKTRKGILSYYGSGIWQGDLKAMRRNRVHRSVKGAGKLRGGAGRSER